MKVLIVLTFLLAGCLAQKPRPCQCPPLLTGALTLSTQSEELWMYSKFLYDAMGQRMRVWELGNYHNKSFSKDYLLNYREGIVYEISTADHTCKKQPLKDKFQPFEIPKNSTLLGQVVLGSSSGPGQGLLVNTWTGELPKDKERYMITVTEFGCIPISRTDHTSEYGWVLVSYFDNVIGITDPGQLLPPKFCEGVEINNAEPVDFLGLFHQKH